MTNNFTDIDLKSQEALEGVDFTASGKLALLDLNIDSALTKSTKISIWEMSNYSVVKRRLREYKPDPKASNIEKVRGYLDAFYHLGNVDDWQRAYTILSFCPNTYVNKELGNQLGIWGYCQEQVQLYSQIIGKLDSQIDAACWSIIGRANSYLGNYQAAIGCHEKSLKISQNFKDESSLKERAWSLQALGITYMDLSQDENARKEFYQALKLFKKLKKADGIASILHNLARIESNQGNEQKAIRLYQKALQNKVENEEELAWIFYDLGRTLINQGKLEDGRKYTEDGLNLFDKKLNHKNGMAWSFYNLSIIMLKLMNDTAALANAEKALNIFRKELKNKSGIAWTQHLCGRIALRKQDYETAKKCYEEKLKIHRKSGNWHGIAYSLEGFATIAAALNQPERSVRLFGTAATIREKYKFPLSPSERFEYENIEAVLKNQIDEVTFATAWNKGSKMSDGQAINEAWEILLSN